MPDQQTLTLQERIAESRVRQAANIAAAKRDARYRRAFAAVVMLRRNGWTIDVWDAADGIHCGPRGALHGPHLCVTFREPNETEPSTGTVAADGSLSGEPLD